MAKKTIKLLGEPIQNEDDKAAEAIVPGMLVTWNGSGNWVKHAAALGPVIPVRVALEREELGKDIDAPYAINDTVKVGVFASGMRFNGLVPTGSPAIIKGDVLESDGAGRLRKATTGTELDIVGVALEALTNVSGVDARLRVEVR
jgi:hypothetical protein